MRGKIPVSGDLRVLAVRSLKHLMNCDECANYEGTCKIAVDQLAQIMCGVAGLGVVVEAQQCATQEPGTVESHVRRLVKALPAAVQRNPYFQASVKYGLSRAHDH